MARRTGSRRTMTALTLRRGTSADRAFVLDLGKRTTLASMSAVRPAPAASIDASYAQLVEFAFDRAYDLIVAEFALTGPVGFVLMLTDLPDEVTGSEQGFVAYMAVEPDARRHGVGKALLTAAEDAARARGLPFVSLMVTESNASARELYAQAGYVTERRLLCKAL
jgi:ribosomal protein S18 acetylase RimI-like enzyme